MHKKYEYNGIVKIIKETYDVKNIIVKLGTEEIDWVDFEDYPLHVDGKIHFKERDIESRSKGFWRVFDVSENDQVTIQDMTTIFAWSNLEGQHLFVFISKTGEVLENNRKEIVSWVKKIPQEGFCTIKLMEIKKSDLVDVASVKANQIKAYMEEMKALQQELETTTSQERSKQQALTKKINQGYIAYHSSIMADIEESVILTLEQKQESRARVKEMFDQTNANDAEEIQRIKQRKKEINENIKELELKIATKDVDELISSAEEEEEEEEEEEKPNKKRKLLSNDKEAGKNAQWLSSEESEEEEDEEDDSYVSSDISSDDDSGDDDDEMEDSDTDDE